MTGASSALPGNYFTYPRRRPGLDHDWFGPRFLSETPGVQWPGGARLALWITVDLEHFPMDMGSTPFVPTGGMLRPYPSYWDYTQRDYGNRVGIFRIMRVLDQLGLRVSVAANSAVLSRYPALAEAIVARQWEVVASGVDMGKLHYGGMNPDEEKRLIAQSVMSLRGVTGQPVTGWHSPANSCSMNTYDLLPETGITYVTDWINDELPFSMQSGSGPLMSLPRNMELSDKTLMVEHHHTRQAYADQIFAASQFLLDEARPDCGRILSLSISPWVLGQPYAITTLRTMLERILGQSGIWCATGSDILAAWNGAIPVR